MADKANKAVKAGGPRSAGNGRPRLLVEAGSFFARGEFTVQFDLASGVLNEYGHEIKHPLFASGRNGGLSREVENDLVRLLDHFRDLADRMGIAFVIHPYVLAAEEDVKAGDGVEYPRLNRAWALDRIHLLGLAAGPGGQGTQSGQGKGVTP